jgi:hypothetical protein
VNEKLRTYVQRLQQSFGAVYTAMEVPRTALWTVAVLLLIHTSLLAYSAHVHSPTLNEPSHLAAGLSHWKFGRFELYRVNPPLVRMVAALPVVAVGYKENWSAFYEGPGARPEIDMGEDFAAANGEQTFFLMTIARWACVPFSWIGAIVCYLWARDLYGQPSGVVACAIWCFDPNILAHASLITADAGATALGLAACYTFWKWLKRATWIQAAFTGVLLGLAELSKTTLILFYPLWPLIWLIYRWPDRCRMATRDWLREACMLALRMVIGLYVLNLGYGFEGSFRQLKDFHFVSDLFTDATSVSDTPISVNRFQHSWLGDLPVPLPQHYLLGIDIQQRDFEHYDGLSYLRGHWCDRGWWYYYLYACAIKVPLSFLGAAFLVVISRLIAVTRRGDNCETPLYGKLNNRVHFISRDEFVLLFPATVIFIIVSSKSGFSEHMRYILPTFPFVFIFTSQIICLVQRASLPPLPKSGSNYLTSACWGRYNTTSHARRVRYVASFATALIFWLGCWFFTSSLWIYPHSLSYFNESIGGPLNGPKHLLGSNVDWGQDLLYARIWFNDRVASRHFLVYSGFFDPVAVGFATAESPCDLGCKEVSGLSSIIPSPDNLARDAPSEFEFAISVNFLWSEGSTPFRGRPKPVTIGNCDNVAARFRHMQAIGNAGYSLRIYRMAFVD